MKEFMLGAVTSSVLISLIWVAAGVNNPKNIGIDFKEKYSVEGSVTRISTIEYGDVNSRLYAKPLGPTIKDYLFNTSSVGFNCKEDDFDRVGRCDFTLSSKEDAILLIEVINKSSEFGWLK